MAARGYKCYLRVLKIEITSCKERAYGIFARVGDVSEIERVSAAPAGSSCGISIVVCARMFSRNSSCYVFLSAIFAVLKPLLKFFRCDVRSRLLNIGTANE